MNQDERNNLHLSNDIYCDRLGVQHILDDHSNCYPFCFSNLTNEQKHFAFLGIFLTLVHYKTKNLY